MLQETRDEFRADFVAFAADHGAERDMNIGAARALRLHGGDGRLDHAKQRALPARVRGADDAGARVGEQQHAAVGAGDAQRERRRCRHQTVAARTLVLAPGPRDDARVARMDLIGDEQALGARSEMRRHARPILANARGLVARADAAVERVVHALRHAAAPRKKGVANVGQREIGRRKGGKFDHRGAMSVSINP